MLRELRVRNLALLGDERVEFGAHLNVITGKTGAGKSLVLAALSLLLGGRFSREMLRTGETALEVEGLFELSEPATVAAVRDALGDDEAETGPLELVLRRRVDGSGRNRCEAEGRMLSVGGLRSLGALLVEVHGQSEHQALLGGAQQTELFDRAAGLVADREAFAGELGTWRAAEERLAQLGRGVAERAARVEELDAVAAEIAALELRGGEQEELRRERTLLANAERHAEELAEIIGLVCGGDASAGDCALDQVGRAARLIEGTAELADEAREAQQALDESFERLSDAARAIEAVSQRVRTDPARLEEVDERLAAIGQVLRRHGPTEEDALATATRCADEADELRAGLVGTDDARAAARALAAKVEKRGRRLNAKRGDAAGTFSERVRVALADLGMEGTRFEVRIDDNEDADLAARATALGLGELSFMASPNPGEDLKPLAKIASGGEIARVALAIKGELAEADRVQLMVFDEIDADVGPRLGEVIGRRLAKLGIHRQVLAVSHLPQVAAYAEHHVHVAKSVADGRTNAHVNTLAGAARELEIAEMIRGEGRGEEALDHARALLAEAREHVAPERGADERAATEQGD